jgi:hypothetical protein
MRAVGAVVGAALVAAIGLTACAAPVDRMLAAPAALAVASTPDLSCASRVGMAELVGVSPALLRQPTGAVLCAFDGGAATTGRPADGVPVTAASARALVASWARMIPDDVSPVCLASPPAVVLTFWQGAVTAQVGIVATGCASPQAFFGGYAHAISPALARSLVTASRRPVRANPTTTRSVETLRH